MNYLKSLANRKQVQKWKHFEIYLHLLIWNSDIIDKRPSLDNRQWAARGFFIGSVLLVILDRCRHISEITSHL